MKVFWDAPADIVDTAGADVVRASRPNGFDDLVKQLGVRDERDFFGEWDARRPMGGRDRCLARRHGLSVWPSLSRPTRDSAETPTCAQ
jgi:hypothetical protein